MKMSTHNRMSRRIIDKHIRDRKYDLETYHTVLADVDLELLALYVERRAPRLQLVKVLGNLNKTIVKVIPR